MTKMYTVRATPNPAAPVPPKLHTEIAAVLETLVPSLAPVSALAITKMPSLDTKRTVTKLACVGECYEFATSSSGVRFAAVLGIGACWEFNKYQQSLLSAAVTWVSKEREIKPANSQRYAILAALKHAMRGLSTPCFKIHRLTGAIIIEVREALTEEI